MRRRGQTWRELARKLPYAGLPFGLCGTRFGVEEIKDWREQEQTAGRPAGLDDFYCSHGLCWHCRSRGYNPAAVDMEGNLPLFDECEACGGTVRQSTQQMKMTFRPRRKLKEIECGESDVRYISPWHSFRR